MRLRTGISRFALLTLLFLLLVAVPAFAATVKVTVNEGGTNSYVFDQGGGTTPSISCSPSL